MKKKAMSLYIKANNKLRDFCEDESGAELIEVLGVIVVTILIIAAFAKFMPGLMQTMFETIGKKAQDTLAGLFPTT